MGMGRLAIRPVFLTTLRVLTSSRDRLPMEQASSLDVMRSVARDVTGR
jgi:hypothetical protein